MDNVKNFPLKPTGDETPSRILDEVKSWEPEDVIVISVVDGNLFVTGTMTKADKIIGLLELGKYKVITDTQSD